MTNPIPSNAELLVTTVEGLVQAISLIRERLQEIHQMITVLNYRVDNLEKQKDEQDK